MSEKPALSDIVDNLSKAMADSRDKRLASYLAEYLVALQLENLGYEVQVMGGNRGADLFVSKGESLKIDNIPFGKLGTFVEVKSSHADLNGFDCAASFGKGKSIEENKFQFCVFVIFENLRPIEYLVFTLAEIKEILKKERGAYPNNPFLLFRYKSLQHYETAIRLEDRLEIEVNLHRTPEKFRNQWSKILI